MELSASAQTWVNLLFLWIGFGVSVGLIAQAVLPCGEPKGFLGILVIGIAGSCLGPLLISVLFRPERFNPIGPLGFLVSVLTALAIFLLYRSVTTFLKSGKKTEPEA